MLVLHAHWQPPLKPGDKEGVIFWCETSDVAQSMRDKGGKKGQAHPFSARGKEVKDLLVKLIGRQIERSYRQITLWLPTDEFGPQPSPYLVHEWEADEGPLTLLQWKIRGVWVTATEGFDILMALSNPDIVPPTVGVSDECRYWQVASRLVLEGVTQQKIRPALMEVQAGKRYEARWLPVLDGTKDGPRLAQLVQAMPAICRADAPNPAETLPPGAILDTFLNIMTDALARRWGTAPQQIASQQEAGHHWLRALFADKPTIGGAAAAIQHAYSSYRAWLRNLFVAGGKTYRVALRLEAPIQQKDEKATPEWALHFFLQARDDPSLLVPAKQVWKTRGSALTLLDRYFEQPQEKLLAGLGYAARFFEPIRRGLQSAKPEKVALSPQEAYTFMRESAPLLEQSGFGLLVPPWWNKPGTRLGVRLKMASKFSTPANIGTGILNMDNLVRYRWEISLGDTTLTREEFDALVNLKSPLVQVRGQWVQLDSEQIEAAINFWEKQTGLDDEISLLQALQLGLDAADDVAGLPVDGVELDDELSEWVAQVNGDQKLDLLPPPKSLNATLRPYQEYGYSWLDFMHRWGMGAILADSMGLGKTIQALTMILNDKEQGNTTGPVLLISPTSVVSNWNNECQRFTPNLTTMVHQGPKRLRGKKFIKQAQEVDLVLTSYALVRRDEKTFSQLNWYGVVLDEAQNIKNSQTKQAKVIRALPAGFRLALTGTPVENRLSELWSIMHFLNPGYLGGQKQFRQNFGLPIERDHDQEATDRLRRLTQPFILRRVKTDPTVIQDLPEKQETKIYCHLTKEQATLYEAVVRDAMADVENSEGIQRKGLIFSLLMKLKQICNHPAQFLQQIESYEVSGEDKRSAKLARLTQMLEELLAEGDRALIFTQFAQMGHLLKRYIQSQLGVSTLFLHGGVPGHKREALVKRFQEAEDGPPIFILSIKAGGTGLNLTRANHVFHFDRWWNPAVEDQATDRAFRIGQKQNVLVHKFVCLGTIEEKVDEMIEQKKSLAESVVGSGENWLTEMSTNDLRELVALREEMMG